MVGAAEREEAAEAEGLRNGQQTLREALEMELVRAAPPHERAALRDAIALALGGGGGGDAAAAAASPASPADGDDGGRRRRRWTMDGADVAGGDASGGTAGGAGDSDGEESAAVGSEGHGWVVPPPPLEEVEATLARRSSAERAALPSARFEGAAAASLQARRLQP